MMVSTVLEGTTREAVKQIKRAYEQALQVIEDPTLRSHFLTCLAIYESLLK